MRRGKDIGRRRVGVCERERKRERGGGEKNFKNDCLVTIENFQPFKC